LAAPLMWPHLHPVPAGPIQAGYLAGLVDGLAGLGLGMVIGLAIERLPVGGRVPGVMAGPACVGLLLGWQAGIVIILAALMLHLLTQAMGKLMAGLSRFPFLGWLGLVSFAWILVWQPLLVALPALRR